MTSLGFHPKDEGIFGCGSAAPDLFSPIYPVKKRRFTITPPQKNLIASYKSVATICEYK